MSALVRKPVVPHPWRFHKWHTVDGLVGLFGIVYQCRRCNLVEVHDLMTDIRWRGSHEMLKESGTVCESGGFGVKGVEPWN